MHPGFDFESRVLTVELADQDRVCARAERRQGHPAKVGFLEQLIGWAGEAGNAGPPLVLCGDLNVAHTDQDLHLKERKARRHRAAA